MDDIKLGGNVEGIELNADILSEKFNDSYSALNQMIKNAEKTLTQVLKI